ncbi:MAG: glutathione S-transferase [Myxococcota bacterium]|nr:glutathione S-transferase [Myxococcota bacterium]
MMNNRPILYSFRRCPYAMRARLAIVAADYDCELREVVLRAKPAAMLDASPKGTVPVMVLSDGRVLEESLDIMRWVLSENGSALWTDDGSDDALIDANDTEFKSNLDRYKYPNRFGLQSGQPYRETAQEFINRLENRLQAHAFLSGARFGFTDAAVAPFVRQFANVDRTWWDEHSPLGVRAWLESFLQSTDYRSIMFKYAAWQEGSIGIPFPK